MLETALSLVAVVTGMASFARRRHVLGTLALVVALVLLSRIAQPSVVPFLFVMMTSLAGIAVALFNGGRGKR